MQLNAIKLLELREARLIHSSEVADPQCESPLKVLFVAESKVDPILRPGAEFLGLLPRID
jgi:hypothetical protein